MSIQTKGARKIVIDDERFLWLIRKQPTYTQECFPGGCIHVAIQNAEQVGSTLVIITDRLHPKGFGKNMSNKTVTPADVRLWIKEAKQLGWISDKPGKSFETKIMNNSLQILK